MRSWSLLALPLLSACAAVGVVDTAQTTVLGTSSVSDTGNFAPLPTAFDTLANDSFGILLNDTRGGYDVLPVVENELLSQAAMLHAEDMVDNNYLSHTSLDGRTVGDRVLEVGYNYSFVAENIAQGFSSQDTVMDAWMDSPGHQSNILDPRGVEFGIAQDESTWVLLLGAQ